MAKLGTFEDKSERLEAVLRKLAEKQPSQGMPIEGIPMSHFIPGMVRSILLSGGDGRESEHRAMREDRLNALRTKAVKKTLTADEADERLTIECMRSAQAKSMLVSNNITKKELEAVATHARKLMDALDAMHKSAMDAIFSNITELSILKGQLFSLERAAKNNKFPHVPPNVGKGRPKKNDAAAITRCALEFYQMLTGKKPTLVVDGKGAYGETIDYIESIFGVIGIKASVEAQIRAYKNNLKNKKP